MKHYSANPRRKCTEQHVEVCKLTVDESASVIYMYVYAYMYTLVDDAFK